MLSIKIAIIQIWDSRRDNRLIFRDNHLARDFSAFLNSRNISACLNQAIRARKPLGIYLIPSTNVAKLNVKSKSPMFSSVAKSNEQLSFFDCIQDAKSNGEFALQNLCCIFFYHRNREGQNH